MELRTKRFIIRDFTAADEPQFIRYQADPRYVALYGEAHANPAKARELLALFAEWSREEPRRNYQLAIVQAAAPHELVGCCGLRDVDRTGGRAELGMELAPQFWGCYGYAIEIIRAMARYAFDELQLDEIYGVTTSGNTRVAKLAKWLGADLVETRSGPEWVQAQGWKEVVWRVRRT